MTFDIKLKGYFTKKIFLKGDYQCVSVINNDFIHRFEMNTTKNLTLFLSDFIKLWIEMTNLTIWMTLYAIAL